MARQQVSRCAQNTLVEQFCYSLHRAEGGRTFMDCWIYTDSSCICFLSLSFSVQLPKVISWLAKADFTQSLRQMLDGHGDLGILILGAGHGGKYFCLCSFWEYQRCLSLSKLLISDRNQNALHLLAGVINLLWTIKKPLPLLLKSADDDEVSASFVHNILFIVEYYIFFLGAAAGSDKNASALHPSTAIWVRWIL